jgi:hypothetical protein
MKRMLVALVVGLMGCSGAKTVVDTNGSQQLPIVCSPMSDCMMRAWKHCGGLGFNMVVHEGTMGGPSVGEWKPSQDGKFHLLISCH